MFYCVQVPHVSTREDWPTFADNMKKKVRVHSLFLLFEWSKVCHVSHKIKLSPSHELKDEIILYQPGDKKKL